MMLRRFISNIIYFNQHNRDCWVESLGKALPAGTRVLDAGAGFCRYKDFFRHCEYKSQDFSVYDKSQQVKGKLDYICDITDIPVEDGSFEVVICSEVLEHVPEPIKVLKELSRVLLPGGRLFLSAPQGCGIHQEPYIFYGGFTPYWYRKFLPEYDLEVAEIIPNGGFFKFYGEQSNRFLSKITPDDQIFRALFFPLKVILGIWFKVTMPIVCHLLDPLDRQKDFTVGYMVSAVKKR